MKPPFLRLNHCQRLGVLCSLFLFLPGSNLLAQTEIVIAKQYLKDNAPRLKLLDADINEMTVSSAYMSPTTGWYHVYFN